MQLQDSGLVANHLFKTCLVQFLPKDEGPQPAIFKLELKLTVQTLACSTALHNGSGLGTRLSRNLRPQEDLNDSIEAQLVPALSMSLLGHAAEINSKRFCKFFEPGAMHQTRMQLQMQVRYSSQMSTSSHVHTVLSCRVLLNSMRLCRSERSSGARQPVWTSKSNNELFSLERDT